jgi:hypothetical protein
MPVSVAKKRYPKWRPVIPAETAPDKCIIFPLSSDHLIRLIQFNMLRACLINYHICAPFLAEKAHDCTNGSLSVCQGLDYPDEVPSTLWPTAMQRTVPHAGWIEIFPHPTWRNNFIQAAGTYEESDLCDDLYGGLFTGAPDSDCERRGIVVWSPAWSFEGWELSEGFVRKWGWSLRGCEDLLEATNRWRALRGEKRIAPTTIESEEFLAVQRVGNAS